MPVIFKNEPIYDFMTNVIVNPLNCIEPTSMEFSSYLNSIFPENRVEYERTCGFMFFSPNTLQTFRHERPDRTIQNIINFPIRIKGHTRNYRDYLTKSLGRLSDHLIRYIPEQRVTMPALGYTVTNLDWVGMMQDYLKDVPHTIEVYKWWN
jgi:hypothetical protein